MKRLAALVLSGLVWAGAVACAQEYALLTQTRTDQAKEGEVVLATRQASFPQVQGLADLQAQRMVNQAIIDTLQGEGGFEAARDYALEDYQEDPERFEGNAYGQDVTVQAAFQGKKLLCLNYEFVTDTGGPHPWTSRLGLLVDLTTGQPVPLAELFKEEGAARALVNRELQRQWEEKGPALEGETLEAAYQWGWEKALLMGEGLLIVYDPGEIGPVAQGAGEYTVGYDLLDREWGAWGGPQDW